MGGYLLDTNVLSELIKKRPSPKVMARLGSASSAGEDLTTSVICVMELRFGAARHQRGTSLWQRIAREVLGRVRIIDFDQPAAHKAGELLALLEAQGQQIGVEDVQIAATALVNRLTVVSRNVRHLARVPGLLVENWWG